MSNPPPPPPPPPPGGGPPPPPPPPPGGFGQSPAQGVGATRAGFGPRLGAAIIDWLLLGVPFWILSAASTSQGLDALISLAQLGVAIWYWGTFEGERGQTVGKRTLGIKTVSYGTNETIGFARAVGRMFSKILSTIPCFLGFFWMLWDPEQQTWHDKIVRSEVVVA